MSTIKQNYRLESRLEVFYTGGAVRTSRDDSKAACACHDEVKVIDTSTGNVLQTFQGDTEPVTSLAWGPNDEYMIIASRSLQLRAFSVETGRPVRSFKDHKAPVADIAIDGSQTLMATASADKSVKVWDISGGYCTHSFTGHRGIVLCCIFHPSQLLLISAGDDSQIKIWDLISKTCVATLQAHFSAVTCLSISEDGWTLLSGGRDGVVVVWNLRDYSKVATVPVYEAIESLVSLPKSMCKSIKLASKNAVVFATGGEKGVVRCWRSDTATCVSRELDNMPAPAVAGSIVELCVSRSSDTQYALTAATEDCRLLHLDIHDMSIGLYRQFIGNNDEVTDVRFIAPAQDGQSSRLAVATNSEHIHVFDSNTLSCMDTLSGHKEAVLSLGYMKTTSGADLLVSGSKDTSVRVWDVSGGQKQKAACIAVGTGHVSAVTAVAFSNKPESKFVISGGADKLLRAWNVPEPSNDASPQSLAAIAAIPAHDKDINAVCVAPNDILVASASQDRSIKVWKMPDLTPVTVLRGHKRGVWSIAFSPIDQAIVSASGDKTIKLWNLKDGTCLRTFEGHIASVLRVQVLSAGTQLMSSGADGLIKLWNIRTAEAVATFDAHEDKVWSLALEDDSGDIAASGGSDGSIAIWKDCTEADNENAAKEAENLAIQEQELQNAVYDGKWEEAAALAIDMGRPGQLLGVVKKALEYTDTKQPNHILRSVSKSLDNDQVKKTLEYCREWNAHSKNCNAAQAMVHAILHEHPQADLLSMKGLDGILDGIEAYTKRHTSRINRLIRSSYIVDFILGVMGALAPASEAPATPITFDDVDEDDRIKRKDTEEKPKKEKKTRKRRKTVM